MERVSPLDASFLAIEDTVNHMHIGSVGTFAGPAPTYAAFCGLIASKLVYVPRYRQKVRTAPASIGRPVWIDDPHFRLEDHVKHCTLPIGDPRTELPALVGRLMSEQLDRDKPLWEDWMVEGLRDGQWALITKVHHCMVDGIAGSDLLEVVLDRQPDPPAAPPDDWHPTPEPSVADLAWHSMLGLARVPEAWARGAVGMARQPDVMLRRAWDVAVGIGRLGGLVRPAPTSTLVGPIGPDRRWDYLRVTLDELKEIRARLGGTVNDVVLAVVTRGFRDLLRSRDESVDNRVLRSLVPVSLRTPDARGVFDNRVTAIFAELPVGIEDPVARLGAVRTQMQTLKASHEADAAEAITAITGFGPSTLTALLTRVAVHRQRSVETVTTNVPGPQVPLYVLGRRMLEAYPYVPISGNIRVGVAIWSYAGGVHFGVTGDWATAPDLSVLCAGIADGVQELRGSICTR
jgi:diacylglycerol O-acyltransferase